MHLATRFVAAVAASPFEIPPCPGRQVGEGICPAQDAKPDLPELSHVFKSDNEPVRRDGSCYQKLADKINDTPREPLCSGPD
jgi:hypothetical protein